MIRSVVIGLTVGLALICNGAKAFTQEAREATLDRIAAQVEAHYVYKDKADEIAKEILGWKSDRTLLGATDEKTFAAFITMRLAPKDSHFYVSWAPPASLTPAKADKSGADANFARRVASSNYGFEKVDRLPGNIGYIKMRFFADFDTTLSGSRMPAARKAGEAALALVQNCDAVIFDLRENGGGSPAMIDLLLAGFFGEKPVLLNRFLEREGNKMLDFTTLANFKGARRPDVPVYVLISGSTASAAEEFAYDVQTQRRGVLLGETSSGAADPGQSFDAGDGFSVFISTGAAVNPITHTNWERVGVVPDVSVAASDALARAEVMALESIVKHGGATTEARWTLERLDAEKNAAALAPKSPQEFTGVYSDREIILEDGALIYRRKIRSPSHKMIPLGGDAFAVEGLPDFRITFQRDPARHITALLIADPEGEIASHPRTAD